MLAYVRKQQEVRVGQEGPGEVINHYALDYYTFFRPNHIYILYRLSENLAVFYKVAQGCWLGKGRQVLVVPKKKHITHPTKEKNIRIYGNRGFF